MIEIIIIIAVVRMFSRKAEEKKLNKILWGFIGAASYYGPILLTSFVILPQLVLNGTITFETESEAMLKVMLINIVVGVLCCIIAYQVLLRQPSKTPEGSDLIDNEVILEDDTL